MVKREVQQAFDAALAREKSILLLGPRQTGKTTLIKGLKSDLYLNLALNQNRRRYELDPDLIIQEVRALPQKSKLIVIDEVQKVPELLDSIQVLIDEREALFVLTGSSARKLRRQNDVNLLPGRLVSLKMDPFLATEFDQPLTNHLMDGSLPGIVALDTLKDKEIDLKSYVDIYLEEEVRSEALVRNLPAFFRFLELAALESGKLVSFNALSKNLGVAHTTIASYYEVLEDCLIIERVDPISTSSTRKKLSKQSKYLFFDMGVRRLSAQEGRRLGPQRTGELFENFIGLELIRNLRSKPLSQVKFWRDPNGPEVDWVIQSEQVFIPIEVKLKAEVGERDVRHLKTFMNEYPCPFGGFVICQSPRKLKISNQIVALPWQQTHEICEALN